MRISNIRLLYAEISTFAHATEDENKVKTALMSLIPEKYWQMVEIQRERLSGHWGNDIIHLWIELKGQSQVADLIKWLALKMSDVDKAIISSQLQLFLDQEYHIHMRFNKQKAYKSILILDDEGDDIIRVKIGVAGLKKLSDARNVYKELELIR
ncbi:MAG: RNA-binding domain-containing protein [Thermoprotei archaeon]